MNDVVDMILAQWANTRPDLDVSPMAPVGRIHRAYRLLSKEISTHMHTHGLEAWEFDMLATLRRSGPPHTLTPKDLVATSMVGSSALTNRVDRLVKRNLVTRQTDPENRRRLLITITDEGLALVDRVVSSHVENERRLLNGLHEDERKSLDGLLRKLLLSLGDSAPSTQSSGRPGSTGTS
ncbi:MarR family transcriptional regulator [Streptomyces sp. NPDC019396]|uniref:MarR family winged helix-turn-helix transcriptional regulator n=1 Tax=Streptomyces sp. NPDC019396 TaxID=3154687 RepID=UPI0033EA3425